MPGTKPLHSVLAALAVAFLIAKLLLLFQITVHWDEFIYLAQTHEFVRGDLTRAFQTFNVHLYSWITKIGLGEIDQIIAGRLVAFVFRVGGVASLFLIARRLYGETGAWLAILALLSFSMLLRHGEEFRSDPALAFLFLACTALLVLRMHYLLAVGCSAFLFGLASALSVKNVIFVPSILLIFLAWLGNGLNGRQVALRLFVFTVVSLGSTAILSYLHIRPIPSSSARSIYGSALDYAPAMWSPPDLETLNGTLFWDWAFWLLLAVGTGMALSDLIERRPRYGYRALILLGMLVPLATLAFYSYSYAYFYTTIIPGTCLLPGLVAAKLESRLSTKPAFVRVLGIAGLALPMVCTGALFYSRLTGDTLEPQRKLLEAVREVFPEPVSYIDRCSMLVDFPQAGLFMSTDFLREYHARGLPIMRSLVEDRGPVLVIANVSGLELDKTWEEVTRYPHQLLREDFEYLKANYIHHWGPLWVAGVQVRANPETVLVDLPVTGTYTLESRTSVWLDDLPFSPGSHRFLAKGLHRIASETVQDVTIRFGNNLRKPEYAPPLSPVFIDMGFRNLPLREARH